MHNFYVCKQKGCGDISGKNMIRQKMFLQKWLYNSELSVCQETWIYSLVYVEGYGMFWAASQMHDSTQPQTTVEKFWNLSHNVQNWPDTIKSYFLREGIDKETIHSSVAWKEKDMNKPYFLKEHKSKEHDLSSNRMKVFYVLYRICKE